MKRILLLALSLLIGGSLLAQTPATMPEKERVVVDFFLRNRIIPAPYVEHLRAQVLGAFADRRRHTVIDAAEVPELASSLPGTGLTTAETAPADLSAFMEMRTQQALAVGARYLVECAAFDYKFEHAQLPSSDAKKPPIQGFRSSLRVLVSAYDLKLNQRLPDTVLELSAAAPVAEDADGMAIASIRKQIAAYIDYNFKIETVILELCPPDKKGRIRELYVHGGTAMGVAEGDVFQVFEEVPIGGVTTRQLVGRLRVNNAQDTAVARCKVTKGDAEIANAFLGKRTLICISDGKALFY